MFEEFSSGYYFGRLYVEPVDVDRAVMQRTQHERANEQVYASGEGVQRLDAPLVVKLENTHIPVLGDDAVPEDTLAVPEGLFRELDIANPPSMTEVLLAKADVAWQLLRMQGYRPRAGT